MSTHRRELLDLLDRLCESRLSDGEHARLEELVDGDDEALRLYLDYITLHGTLHWDTASSDDSTPLAKPAAMVGGAAPDSPYRNRRRVWTLAAACLALIAVAATLFNGPGGDQVAGVDDQPNGDDRPAVVSAEDGNANNQSPPPIVRLDSRDGDDQPTVIVDADSTPSSADVVANDQTDIVAYIDEELADAWASHDVTPSPTADDAEWVRRASLDLAGRIPDLDTVRAFLDDVDPAKREKFIAQRLRGGDFAEHLTTVWANLLVGRSDSTAHERRGLEQFLLTQFRQNRPWSETVSELIAAEGSVEENGASGFLLAHLNNEAVPATAITARLFLGEQVQCSQCHKHPWNEESQEKFWTLNAFFHQTDIERQAAKDGKDRTVPVLVTREIGGPIYYENLRGVMQVAYPEFGGEAVDARASTNRRQELARLLSSEDGHQLAKAFVNRMWAHFFGSGFVNPIDDMGPHQPATHPELLERLASEFVESGYNISQLVVWITSSKAYQLSSRMTEVNTADDPSAGDPPLFSRMYVKPLSPEQLFNSILAATDADRVGRHYEAEVRRQRQEWVQQFFEVLENEENGELSTFDGTLPQALTMMNGPLVQAALGGDPGTLLHRVASSRTNDFEKIRQLCLAALSREPTERERNLFVRHVRQTNSPAAKQEALRDVFWAYLNSNEFVVNH